MIIDLYSRDALPRSWGVIGVTVHDYMDVGGRVPTVGALGDAGSSYRGRTVERIGSWMSLCATRNNRTSTREAVRPKHQGKVFLPTSF
jgi:hypothetical protein